MAILESSLLDTDRDWHSWFNRYNLIVILIYIYIYKLSNSTMIRWVY